MTDVLQAYIYNQIVHININKYISVDNSVTATIIVNIGKYIQHSVLQY